MARLSTGQSYGDTSRRTSQRLLGGAAVIATPGVLAEQTINMPQLQPAAAPVNTFQQSGAPTLGGPVRMFAPPDLPRPSQDMANLAAALGSFNPVLQNIGQMYVQDQKRKQEAAKVIGAQFGAQLARKFPGQDLAQVRDTLSRRAAAGDEEAAAALTVLQAKSPLQQRFTDLYLQRTIQRVDINTALSRWQTTSTVTDDDGNEYQLDDLEIGHPLALRKMNELIPMPRDPSVYVEDQNLRYDAHRQMMQDHARRRVARKNQQSDAVVQGKVTSIFLDPNPVNAAQSASEISQMLTEARVLLGPEQYRKTVENLDNYLAAGALAGSVVNGKYDLTKYNANMQLALELQRGITAGPNGEPYLDALGAKGGTEAQLALSNKLMEQYGKMRGNLDSISGFAGQDLGRDIASQYRLDDPSFATSDPLGYEQAEVQARAQESRLPVEQRGAFRAEIDKAVNGTRFGPEFTQKQIERQEFDRLGSLDADPATEIARIKERVRTGQMTPAQGRQYMNQWQEQQSQELLPIRQAADKEINRLLDIYEKQFNLDGVVTQEERDQLIALRANLSMNVRRQIAEGTKAGKGYGQVQQEVLNTLKDPKLLPAPPVDGPNSTPRFKDANEWGNSLGMFGRSGRGNAAANQNLKLAVEKGIIFSGEKFEEYFNNWVGKGQIDPDLKLMIERAGYGSKPSEFFIRQWNNLYNRDPNRDPLPVPGIEKLQQRDKDGMRATPSPASLEGRMMPFGMIDPTRRLSSSQRLMQNLQGLINNTFTPPAAAGTMDLASAGPVVATGGMGGLLGLIRSGEGGWTSVNRGRAGDSSPIRDLTSMPIGVVEDMQKRGRVFAVGAYQFTPGVLSRARKEAGLSPNAPMTPENQNKMGMALILGSKRPALAKYVRGESNDLNAAHLDIASEWAALQGPNGRGVYDGDKGGNMASIPAARVRAALQEARRAYLSGRR
jgi:hypothetical protein